MRDYTWRGDNGRLVKVMDMTNADLAHALTGHFVDDPDSDDGNPPVSDEDFLERLRVEAVRRQLGL